ncbi:MAG TPA: dihydrolipoyl dehydrogenase [Candidatus Didemnitutus sp.]|nr:dihydrolipoyl dehydrogenase [Candidatus Didemnitutus sp.]
MADAIYDLVIIGGGPAGYVGAIRAGQLGAKVACIELERAGGTCLNWGCIPTKALLRSAELYRTMQKADAYGLSASGVGFDFDKVIQRSRGVSNTMAKGVEFLFKKNKVDYFTGRAQVTVPGMVEITEGEHKGKFLRTKNVMLCTGQKPRPLPGLPVDGTRVMTSREALVAKAPPKSLAIIGAGAIGVEFAYFFNAFGSKVTLIEMLPQILPVEDEEIAKVLHRSFEKQGIAIHTGTKSENIRVGEKSVKLDLVKDGQKTELEVDTVLVAIGITSNLDALFSSKVKVDTDRGFVKVGPNYQTSVPGIFAAGDIQGPPWLAHVASFRAINAVNGILGKGTPKQVGNFPGCTYCQPQVASTGLTEKACKEKGLNYKVGKFPFTASGKAVASGDSEGFVKVISDAKTGEILGVHIIGSEATELIAEYGLAMNLEATVDEVHHAIHAHPTLSEALAEAAAATTNEAIHI